MRLNSPEGDPHADACQLFTWVVVRGGVEPPTFRFSGGRSYQLSYLAERHPGEPEYLVAITCDPDGTRTRDLRRDRAAR